MDELGGSSVRFLPIHRDNTALYSSAVPTLTNPLPHFVRLFFRQEEPSTCLGTSADSYVPTYLGKVGVSIKRFNVMP